MYSEKSVNIIHSSRVQTKQLIPENIVRMSRNKIGTDDKFTFSKVKLKKGKSSFKTVNRTKTVDMPKPVTPSSPTSIKQLDIQKIIIPIALCSVALALLICMVKMQRIFSISSTQTEPNKNQYDLKSPTDDTIRCDNTEDVNDDGQDI